MFDTWWRPYNRITGFYLVANMNWSGSAGKKGSIETDAMSRNPPVRPLEHLLVPDLSAARRLRRLLASEGARTGVVVGPWHDLLHRARRAYLINDETTVAESRFREQLAAMSEAFWQDSLQVAPEETGAEVRRALIDLVGATEPDRGIDLAAVAELGDRPRCVVRDLAKLADSLAVCLPGDLGLVRKLLDASVEAALHPVRVNLLAGSVPLTRWQCALVEKLNRDADRVGTPGSTELAKLLQRGLSGQVRARPGSSLVALQRHLFEHDAPPAAIDKTVQCVSVRDFHQEAETAAGMAQGMLAANRDLKPADIGVLLPDDFGYTIALEDAFGLAGLPLSGRLEERWRRDLGAEAIFHFLFCRQKPAPAMALAACLSSPLMPWTTRDGAVLAKRVMDGEYNLRPPVGTGPEAAEMVDLIRNGDSQPSGLAAALRRFADLLAAGEGFELHRERARESAEIASEALAGATAIDWTAVRRATTPRYLPTGTPARFSLEGVTVLREHHEPWRDVRHLFVLGFHQGNYPREARSSPVFSLDELHAVEQALGIDLTSGGEETHFQRTLFRRQLRAASDSVTFLISRRRVDGRAQSPSTSLVFIERLFSNDGRHRNLVLEIDAAGDRARMQYLATVSDIYIQPPREFRTRALQLETDLFALQTGKNGRPRPESPSSLQTLLVSPLAWLLRRIRVEPIAWSPETASPSVIGTLVHGAFERTFRPGADLPTREELRAAVHKALDDVAIQQAPFLRGPQWRVERLHIREQTANAAEAWLDALEQLGATVVASEQWLEGTWSQLAVHGRADLILTLGEDKLLIVDYKWSSASKHFTRMEGGYDTQASIYRAMALTGGPKRNQQGQLEPDASELAKRLRQGPGIGVLYFTMRDCAFLADQGLPGPQLPGWRCVSEDVARSATAAIESRIADVRSGIVSMNVTTDRETFAGHGLPTYALDASPLVELFTHPPEPEESLE